MDSSSNKFRLYHDDLEVVDYALEFFLRDMKESPVDSDNKDDAFIAYEALEKIRKGDVHLSSEHFRVIFWSLLDLQKSLEDSCFVLIVDDLDYVSVLSKLIPALRLYLGKYGYQFD